MAPAVIASPSAKPPAHPNQVSIPAMVVLALFLLMMAALALGVILRQRKATAALKRKENIPQQSPPSARACWSTFSRFKPRSTSAAKETPTAVGALHATSVLVAAAPGKVFAPPMTMHFRIHLEDKTVLILGAPWCPTQCGAQCCGAPANDKLKHVEYFNGCDRALLDLSYLHEPNAPPTSSPSYPTTTDPHSCQAIHRDRHRCTRSHPTPEVSPGLS